MRFLPTFKYRGNGSYTKPGRSIVVLLFCLLSSYTPAKNTPEYTVKAAFLIHFMDFATWPNSKSDGRTICILGDSPFKKNVLASVKRQNQEILIKYTSSLSDARGCHLLFIARSEKYQLNQILTELANKPILAVSDIKGFAGGNGMIELATKSGKIKLLINLKAVKLSGLKLSSNLIELAQVVDTKTKPGVAK